MTKITPGMNSFDAEIVREQTAIKGLEDGKMYVLATRNDAFVNAVETSTKNFKVLTRKEGLVYPYDVRVVEDFKRVSTRGVLYRAVQKGANLIVPISTPNLSEKSYVVAKSNKALLDMHIPSMVMQAEEHTKAAIVDALINLAVQEPESCKRLLKEIFPENEKELDKQSGDGLKKLAGDVAQRVVGKVVGVLGGIVAPSAMHMLSTVSDFEVPSDTTHKEAREIISRFVDNMKRIRRSANKAKLSKTQAEKLLKARSEVNYVFKLFTTNVYAKFVLHLMVKNDVGLAFDNCINRDLMAAKSKIKVSVQPVIPEVEAKFDPKVVNKLGTNGKLRVYLTDGEKTVQVPFGRSAACVIYIMYLLDRKQRGDDVDTIKIVKNEKLYSQLYRYIYNESNETIKGRFDALDIRYDEKVKYGRLSDYYSDIRDALDKAVAEFGESPMPFFIPNRYSHIAVLKENISVPEMFDNVEFVY